MFIVATAIIKKKDCKDRGQLAVIKLGNTVRKFQREKLRGI